MSQFKNILTVLTTLVVITSMIIGCGGSSSLNTTSPRELYDQAMSKYQGEKYLRAIELFQAVIYNYPGESVVDTAQYYLGLSYFGSKEYMLASVEFNRLVINYPASDFFDDAMFMRGYSHYKSTPNHFGLDQTDLEKAITYLKDFIIDFPESNRIGDATDVLAEAEDRLARKTYESGIVYSRIGGYRAARIYFQEVLDNYTNSNYAALSAFYLAEMDFKMRKYDDARVEYEKFSIVYPNHLLATEAHDLVVESLYMAGEQFYNRNKFDSASARFENLIELYPKHKRSSKANKYLRKITKEPASLSAEAGDETS